MATDVEKVGIDLFIKGLPAFLAGLKRVSKASTNVAKSFDLQKQSIDVLGFGVRAVKNNSKAMLQYFDKTTKSIVSVSEVSEALAKSFGELDTVTAALAQGIDLVTEAMLEEAVAAEETKKKTDKLGQMMATVASKGGALALSIGLGMISAAGKVLKGVINGLISVFKKLVSPITKARQALKTFFNRVMAVATGVLIRDVIFGIIQAVRELKSEMVSALAEFQKLEIRFQGLYARQLRAADSTLALGESYHRATQMAQGMVEWVKQIGLTIPFDVEIVGRMTAFSMAMGFAADEARNLTLATANFAAASGLSSVQMERIIFNFAQMKRAGKVAMTELRDLARGAFFPLTEVLDVAAKNLGIASDNLLQFREDAAAGKISIEDFFAAFQQWVGTEMPEATKRLARTFEGVTTRFMNFVKTVLAIDIVGPAFNKWVEQAADLLDKLLTPEVREQALLIGQALLKAYEAVSKAISESFIPALQSLLQALNFGEPSARKLAKAIITIGVALGALIDIVSAVVDTLADWLFKEFDEIAETAHTWGRNIVSALAEGMATAITFIVQVINTITRILRQWFAPGSPPKVAPRIDVWGAKTMNEWLKGFLKADWTIFNKISDKIERFLRSIPGGIGKDNIGLIPAILGARANVMKAIDEVKKGIISIGDAAARIIKQTKKIGGVFKNYIVALFQTEIAQAAVTKASKEAAKAQAKIDKITDKYTKTLDALNKQLQDITTVFDEQQRIEKIALTLSTRTLTANERMRLERERQELTIKKQIRTVEEQRDAELQVVEAQLEAARLVERAAQIQLDTAREQLTIAEEMIDYRIKQNELIKEQMELLKRLAEAAKAAGAADITEPLGAGAIFDLEALELPDIDSIVAEIDTMFKEVKREFDLFVIDILTQWYVLFGPERGEIPTKLKQFGEDWLAITTGMKEDWDAAVTDVGEVWDTFVKQFNEDITPMVENIAELVEALSPDLRDSFTDLGDALDNLVETMGGEDFSIAKLAMAGMALVMKDVEARLKGAYLWIILINATIMGLTSGFETAIVKVGELAEGVQEIFDTLENIKEATDPVEIVVGGFQYLWTIIETLGAVLKFGFDVAWGFVEGFLAAVKTGFEQLSTELVGESIVPDMLQQIADFFEEKLGLAETAVTDFALVVKNLIETELQNFVDFVIDPLAVTIQSLVDTELTNLDTIIADTLTVSIDEFVKGPMGDLIGALQLAIGKVSNLISQLGNLAAAANSVDLDFGGGGGGGGSVGVRPVRPKTGRRQFGGFLQRGVPSIVGEVGPELFIPDISGFVVQTRQMAQALNTVSPMPAFAGGTVNNITIEVNPTYADVQSEASLYYDVVAALSAVRV